MLTQHMRCFYEDMLEVFGGTMKPGFTTLQLAHLTSIVIDGLTHRGRLLDAMAFLLVDLHRSGVFWGDCSLANTLFRRDGDRIQAYLVDAETSEVFPSLSDGQRAYDVEILVENVAFGLRVRPRRERPAEAEIAARVRRLLEMVQVPELERRWPEQLSGGQRQRVALARALATEPPLLLLDEPFGALDAKVRRDLRGWLRGLHERLGLTSVLVTHDQEEAFALADQVAVMRAGRVEQVGSPAALAAGPATEFVAEFLSAGA